MTVLFVDMRGSMDLSERLQAEAWHGILDRYFSILCAGVQRFEGTVAQFTGDGIMALFGAPIAHEDHARLACHAAVHLAEELERYGALLEREHGLEFAARIGLNSGEVVLGSIGDDLVVEYTALGHSVGLAQRMESLAEPGSAYLTDRTAALVSGYFELEEVGRLDVRGHHDPVRVYRLLGPGPALTALDVARARGLSRLVGRERELEILDSTLGRTLRGDGQVLGIVAEPGVGKSRLVFEFAQSCRARGIAVYKGHALPHGRAVGMLPVLELLRGYFGLGDSDPDEPAREKIAATLAALDEDFDRELPLIFDFLGVTDPAEPHPAVDPEARRRRVVRTLERLVRAQARRAPTVLVVEDLHWLDPGSRPFLEALAGAAPGTRTLFLATFRPEYEPEWPSQDHRQRLELEPLGSGPSAELLRHLLGDDPTLSALTGLIGERAEGNPFFIEEVVRDLAESGRLEGGRGAYRLGASTGEIAIPATVEAILAARIDRLPDREKAVLQTASVVGKRDFPLAVLRRVAGLSEGELRAALGSLIDAEFLRREPDGAEVEYAFEHPLTHEVAYRSQLTPRRAGLHAAAAAAIEALYPEKLDERAALLAYHSEEAGETLAAARWHARAAEWAGINDQREAIRHWRRVRALTAELPESESADLADLGRAARVWLLDLGWRAGMSEREADEIFEEGKLLAERSGVRTGLPYLLLPYGMIRAQLGHLDEFLELRDEAQRLADAARDRGARLAARAGLMYGSLLTGRLAEAVQAAREAIDLVGDNPAVGVGAGVRSFGAVPFFAQFRGFLLGITGDLEQGGRTLERGVEIARDRGDLELVAWGRVLQVWSMRYSGAAERASDIAREAVEIGERTGGTITRATARLAEGIAHLLNEDWSRAVEALERSLAIAKKGGAGTEYAPWMLTYLAEALLGGGQPGLARARAEEAAEIAGEATMLLFELEAQLTLGRALLGGNGAAARPAASRALGRALELVDETAAKSAEPLIRVELARLARESGEEARCEGELRMARRLFTEVGAAGHLARLDSAPVTP